MEPRRLSQNLIHNDKRKESNSLHAIPSLTSSMTQLPKQGSTTMTQRPQTAASNKTYKNLTFFEPLHDSSTTQQRSASLVVPKDPLMTTRRASIKSPHHHHVLPHASSSSRQRVSLVRNQEQEDAHDHEKKNSDSEEEDDYREISSVSLELDHTGTEKHVRKMLGKSYIYQEKGKIYQPSIDKRGLTPYATFTTNETPPSQKDNPILHSNEQITCGFCNSTNLHWTLKCGFCGCGRMSDAPRLKYLLDMIISVEPLIKVEDFAKKVLDYAKFDRVAIKAEKKFKQASILRAKTAIIMMNRTVNSLRSELLRIIFLAWKKAKSVGQQHDSIMMRLITIKNLHIRSRIKQTTFALWKGHTERIRDERMQRFALASRRNEEIQIRRIWSTWQRFVRSSLRKKLSTVRGQLEMERDKPPVEAQLQIDRLKEVIQASKNLMIASMEGTLHALCVLEKSNQLDVQEIEELHEMYPTTIGPFFDGVQGKQLLICLRKGEPFSGMIEDSSTYKTNMDTLKNQTKAKINKMLPSESIIQWLNFQRKRCNDDGMGGGRGPLASIAASASVGSNLNNLVKFQVMQQKDNKKKEFKEIKGLQDLKISLSSPQLMIRLLCHTSNEAQAEYENFLRGNGNGGENPTAQTPGIDPNINLSPVAQVQLRNYFKIVFKHLHVPPDIISRDSFAINDFDALYAYLVYLYSFHPNFVSPSQRMTYHPTMSSTSSSTATHNTTANNSNALQVHTRKKSALMTLTSSSSASVQNDGGYYSSTFFENFIGPWQRIKRQVQDEYDAFAQQKYLNFVDKIKKTCDTFGYLQLVARHTKELSQYHQRRVLQDNINDFSRRVLGKDSNVSISLEKETLASWVSLTPHRLLPLCENQDELKEIELVFKTYVLELIKIFRIYGSGGGSGGGKGLLEQEFLKVMTRAGLTDRKNMLRQQLQTIYQQSRIPAGAPGAGYGNSTSGNNAGTTNSSNGPNDLSENSLDLITEDRGATPNEFFEALVRVAFHNFQKRKEPSSPRKEFAALATAVMAANVAAKVTHGFGVPHGSGDTRSKTSQEHESDVPFTSGPVGSSTSAAVNATKSDGTPVNPSSLLYYVRELVIDRIVPMTKKFQEQGLTFKKQLVHPEVQQVCKAQEKKLKRVFQQYSMRHKNPNSKGKCIELSDFETLLKDKHLLDALFPHGKIKQLFAFVQAEPSGAAGGASGGGGDASTGGDNNDPEFVYSEFIEALAAIAVYRNANPYLPFAKKLETFFDEFF